MTALTDTELDALHAAVNHYGASVVADARRLALDSAGLPQLWEHHPAFAAKLRDLADSCAVQADTVVLRYGAMRTALTVLADDGTRAQSANECSEAVAP